MSKQKKTLEKHKNAPESQFLSSYARIMISEWRPMVDMIRLHGTATSLPSSPSSSSPPPTLEQETQEIQEEVEESTVEEDEHTFNFSLDADTEEVEDDFGFELESFEDYEEEETVKEAPAKSIKQPPLLTQSQIDLALTSPYHQFIKMMIAAYAKIARLRYEKHINKEDIFKGQRASLPEELVVSANKIDSVTFAVLDSAKQQLNAIAQEFHGNWQSFYADAAQKIIATMQKHEIVLTEYETKEFYDEEHISELLPRFVELKLAPPKAPKLMDFSYYFTVKTHLALQSCLSRQHFPHTDNDIKNLMKKYKADFAALAKQEIAMLKEQQQQIDQIIKTTNW